jgi:MoaA/NifB/PqqE/SkfB family radical SAM enzyme
MQYEKQLKEYLEKYFSLSDRINAFFNKRFYTLELEIIEKCNLNCTYCYPHSSKKSGKIISFDKLKEIIDNAVKIDIKEIVLLGGEPLLHPNWSEILIYAKEKGIKRNILYTNGSLIKKNIDKINSCVDWIRLHLDSIETQTFAESQGSNESMHSQIIDSVDLLVRSGFPGKNIELVVPLTKKSYSTLKETLSFAREKWGVVMTTLITLVDYGKAKEMVQKEKLTKKEYEYAFEIRAKMEKRPWLIHLGSSEYPKEYQTTTFMITVRGDVIPYPAMPSVGNIYRDNLNEIIKRNYDSLSFKNLLNNNGRKNELKGECGSCENSKHCFGNRSMAFNNGKGLNCSDPTCWLVNEFPHK